jgi:hypothetical protein
MPNLLEHIRVLDVVLIGLRDPLPPATPTLFNRLLEEAQTRCHKSSFVREIPQARLDAGRAELLVWIAQLKVSLRPEMF